MPDDTPTSTSNTPSTSNHAYDNTTLDSLQFLAAVVHSPEVPLEDRIKAAEALLPFAAKPQPSAVPWHTYTSDGRAVPGAEDVTIKIVVPSLS
jgi:hypothetical protein